MPVQDLTATQRAFIEQHLGVALPVDEGLDEPDPQASPEQAEWESLARDLGPRIEALVADRAPGADRVAKAWGQAETLASKGEYRKALDASAKIAAALDQIEKIPEDAKGVGGVSLVKLGIARNQWPALHAAAHTGIGTLKSRLRAAYAPYPDEASKVEAAINQIDRVITTLDDSLKNQLDDVYNAQDENGRVATISVVRRTVTTFRDFVANDPVASAIDGNSFAPEVSPIAPLRKNLDDMMAALGG